MKIGRNFIKEALQQVVGNMERTKMGLYLPPDYIAGRHFGGFSGYDPWVQDCIRAACLLTRGVTPDELSELAAWVMWNPHGVTTGDVFVDRYAAVMRKIEEFGGRISDALAGREVAFTEKAKEQIRRVDGTRQRGTLMVIAFNCAQFEATGEVKMAVSAWNPADIEEAKAVPKQPYLLG